MADLTLALGIGAAVILAAVLAVRVSVKVGLPSLLLYLGIGVLLGEAGFGIEFSNADLTQALGLAALVLILTEGGLTTRWDEVKPALWPGIALSTVAVVISVGVAGAMLHWILGLDWRMAMLWGAVLASTDAAAVFSVLRNLSVTRRLVGSLELESGMNDAPCYIAVVLLASTDPVTWTLPLTLAYELGVGAVIGLGLGWLGTHALRRAALPATGLYPLATVAVCILAFAGGQAAHASGLLATYIAGLVLGNSKLPHRADTVSFAEGLGWLAQIGLFVLLGLFASPSRLLDAIVPGLVAGAVVTLLARPLSVLISTTPFRVPWREQVFLSWAGLRGAVPIVLAMIPLSQGVPGATQLVDAVFVLVIVLTLVQGSTLGLLARVLKLDPGAKPKEVEVDVATLDELDAELLQVTIPPGSKLHGVYLAELRLPPGATVSLVAREGKGFTPGPTTRLQEGDQILVVTTQAVRSATETRIRAVDRAGRYARWKGESGKD
ncbi:potassium/proton antiporter, CPA1 family [Actinokineospora alba]|uniref:Potassium/proton antiporter, CPA1 family n=1 Tax=Actinokineospora alba TaxID=504798 RepID=A0A1H0MRV3_9PSEU|nr:potassium/proton antiporter [Actinokineospora alba]TDP68409.1 potassium/proton antiporter (CPA1 family) [Actinokineospora alba]SDH78521.1 cell volume regulation protein A [Actinokineospora alba]SDO83179.1 potassium/proton antiporter, CPA1 family [Actinokineospora alba]